TTNVDGTVIGNTVAVQGDSNNAFNDTSSIAVVKVKPKGKLAGLAGGKVKGKGPFSIAGAIAIANGTNNAAAELGPHALVTAYGNLSVTSRAEDNHKAFAVGASEAPATFSIGGAITLPVFTNTATATLDNGARTNAVYTTLVQADAVIPNQIEV